MAEEHAISVLRTIRVRVPVDWVAGAVVLAGRLGIARALAAGPRSVESVAGAVGADRDAVHRLLRALVTVGMFTQPEPGWFGVGGRVPTVAATKASTDFPRVMADARTGWSEALHSVRTGRSGFEQATGVGYFDFLARHGDHAEEFAAFMDARGRRLSPALVQAFSWGRFQTIVDVGGGTGQLLAAILAANFESHGVLCDAWPVIRRPVPELPIGRCALVGGDFFASVPSGHDCYLLARVLHNWGDDDALAILRRCRQAIADDGTLVIVDMIVPTDDAPHPAKWFDLHMLVMFAGRERTRSELAGLLERAGFDLVDVHPTGGPESVVEARPAL